MNSAICGRRQGCDEFIVETLVVALCVMVDYVFGYRCPKVSLTEGYDAVETLSTDGWLEGGGASRLHLSRAHVPPR